MFPLPLIIRPFVPVASLILILVALVPNWQGPAHPPNHSNGESQMVAPGQTPNGLGLAAWADIQAQIAARAYQVVPALGTGYRSANPAHGWQIGYSTNGTTRLTPRD